MSDREFGKKWTAPTYLSPAGLDASAPRLAANAGTHGVVVVAAWLIEKAGVSSVQAAVRSPVSRQWQPPLDVSTAMSAVPRVAVDGVEDAFGEARPRVFWLDHGGSHWRVRAASLSWKGDLVTARRAYSDGSTDAADLAVRGDFARYYVSWTRFDGGNWRAEWIDSASPNSDPSVLDIAGEDMRTPLVGFFGVAWTSEHAEGIWVRAVTHTWGGLPWGAPVTLSDVARDATDLSMPVNEESDLVLVWAEHEGAASTVMSVTGDPAQSTWLPATSLSTQGLHADSPAAVGDSAAWTETFDGHTRIAYAVRQQTGWSLAAPVSPAGTDATEPGPTDVDRDFDTHLGPAVLWLEGSVATATVVVRGLDLAAPVTTMRRAAHVQTNGSAKVGWQVADDWSAIASVDVRYRERSWLEPPSTRETVMLTLPGSARRTQIATEPGHRYCFAARATDAMSRTGRWSHDQCVSAPVDDRQLTRSTGWTAGHDDAFYEGTYLGSRVRGSKLEVPISHARTISLMATTGVGQGTLKATYRGVSVVVDLARGAQGAVTIRRLFDSVFVRSGTLRITVTSAREPVRIDGIAVS